MAKARNKARSRGRAGVSASRTFSVVGSMPAFTTPGSPFKVLSRVTGTAYFSQSTSTIAVTDYAKYVSLGDFVNLTGLAAYYDQYRIELAEAWVTFPYFAPSEATAEPALYASAIDLDDASAPTAPVYLAQKPGAQFSTLSVGHYHKWRPQIASAVYKGAFSGYADPGMQWLDCSNTDIQHYGLKLAIDQTLQVIPAKIFIRVHVAFRGLTSTT